jgi:hypothetical protein
MAALGESYAATMTLVPHKTVSFAIRIEGINATRLAAASLTEPLCSPEFIVDGDKWCIEVFLRGCSFYRSRNSYFATAHDHTAINLQLMGAPTGCAKTVDATISAAGRSRNWSARYFYPAGPSSVSNIPTADKLFEVPHTLILDSSADGVLTITATLRRSGEARVVRSPVRALSSAPVPPADKSLMSQLAELRLSGRDADVTLQCSDGEVLAAHAWLLSLRSPVFAVQFSGPLASESKTLTVPDDIQSSVMRRVLDYVYADELTVASPEEGQHLLNAADHYEMTGLLAIAERALLDGMTVEAAAFTLTLAEQHGAAALKRAALNFIAAHSVAVMDTPGWAHLRASCPALLEEVIRTMGAGPQQA